MKINLSQHGISKKKNWIIDLQKKFAADHDLRSGITLQSYLSSPGGARSFAEWLNGIGFDAKFWCLEPHVTYDGVGRKQVDHIAFGVEFEDKCPMLTEIKLKS